MTLEVTLPGIIPARAGFTERLRSPRTRGRDHPRSRGVYWRGVSSCATAPGSSPLARGLRAIWGTICAPGRIIPARAGFTDVAHGHGFVLSDHPRSRGVYPHPKIPPVCRQGSSPLARGLLLDRHATRDQILDHPRSRGVYSERSTRRRRSSGSSPLARGLLVGADAEAEICGSSPLARGLRRWCPSRTGGSRDHPRSRGVYESSTSGSHSMMGSSPLARGLHLRILGIPTNPYSTRPLPPSLPTRGPLRRVARAPPSFGAPPAADGRDLEDADATRPPRVSDPGSGTAPTRADERQRRPARSGSRRSGGSAPPRSRG